MLKALVKGPLVLLEPEVLKRLRRLKGRVFVDIGANVGLYTLLLQPRFNRVHAVEPNPEMLVQLKDRVANYDNVSIHPVALSDHDGETMLYLNREEPHCSGSADTILPVFNYRPQSNPSMNRSTWQHDGIMVKAVTYDSLFPGPVDLVKVDVEGAEFLVLYGMRKSLKNGTVKNLVVELHDRERRQELETLFAQYGYAARWLDADHLFAWSR